MKRCTKCGETKAEDEFCRRKDRSDGRNSRCRRCMSEVYRRYHEENLEKELERFRRYRKENREAILERAQQYREENREAILEGLHRHREGERRVSKKYATKSGPYSPEEDLVVMRTDMTILEIAIALGRTYNSVDGRRRNLRKKEKTNV